MIEADLGANIKLIIQAFKNLYIDISIPDQLRIIRPSAGKVTHAYGIPRISDGIGGPDTPSFRIGWRNKFFSLYRNDRQHLRHIIERIPLAWSLDVGIRQDKVFAKCYAAFFASGIYAQAAAVK
jgi:hypothetical protein